MNLTLIDLIVAPPLVIVILVVFFFLKPRLSNGITQSYFMPALIFKMLGAIALGLIYAFYYGGGDTFNFYHDAKVLNQAFYSSPSTYLKLLLKIGDTESAYLYLSRMHWKGGAEYTMSRIISLISLSLGGAYMGVALIFSIFSFLTSWYLYTCLVKKYVNLSKELAIAALFIPSVIVWGSGVMKDTLTFGGVCLIVGAVFRIIEHNKFSLREVILIVFASVLIYNIKIYILLTLFPSIVIWVYAAFASRIRNVVLKIMIAPILLTFFAVGGYYGTTKITEGNALYDIDNIAERAAITAYDLRYWTGRNAGSGYSLGDLDGSWQSMISKFPLAVNVSLFRPYLWEVSNPLMLLSALESLLFLIFTLRLLFKGKFKLIYSEPFIIFCLVFSIIFGFAVGVSSYNFGTLVRYKIPMMPFYAFILVILSGKRKLLKVEN